MAEISIGVAQRVPLAYENPSLAFGADIAATLAAFPGISANCAAPFGQGRSLVGGVIDPSNWPPR